MAGGVGEQLAGDREHELVVQVDRLRVELDLDLEAALALGLAGDRAERLLEPALLERHRVQRQQRLAQALDRRRDDLVGALDLHPARRRLDQLLVGGEQVCSESSWISWAIRRRPWSSASITLATSWRQVLSSDSQLATSARRRSFSARGPRRPRRHYSSMPAPHRLGDGGGAIGDAELLVERVQVALDRRRREVDLLADVGRREALGDEPQHLLLAVGELRRAAAALALLDLAREAGLRLGGERGAAAGDRDDRLADLLARGLLREIALGAGGDGLVGELGLHEGREEQDLGRRGPSRRIADEHLGAVEPGHADVEHGDLGAERLDLLQRLAPVGGLADQLEVGALVDRAHDPLPVDRVVVGDEDRDALLLRAHPTHESMGRTPCSRIRKARCRKDSQCLSPRPSVTSD